MDVWTARVSSRDPDAFDVTRKSGDPVFAPSWGLLMTVVKKRRNGDEVSEEDWKAYASGYLREMSHSFRNHGREWAALRARPRVVLTCYCTDHKRCHRTLLGLVLTKLGGATFHGEIDVEKAPEPRENRLFLWAMSFDDDSE